jgi:hypothetical protein
VLKLLGIVALVALILVGALMPLRYTARMQLPRVTPQTKRGDAAGASLPDDGNRED